MTKESVGHIATLMAQRMCPMPTQRILIGPDRFLHWRDQRALVQGKQVAGEIVVRGARFGRNHLIAMRDPQ